MDVEATPTIRLICALLILIPSIIGVILQIIILVAIRLGWKVMRSNSFYIMMLQITISNVIALFTDLYIAFPITLTGVQYMGDSLVLYHVPLFLEGFAFRVLLFFSFLLAINRTAIFLFPKMNALLFSVKGTMMLSFFGWTYSATILILNDVFGCEKIFSKDEFYFGYVCINRDGGQFHYADFVEYHSYVIPILMILMYIIICIKIKISRRSTILRNTDKVEMRFLSQTIPLSVLLSIEVITFTFLPKLHVTGYGRFFINSITTLSIISNNISPPVILLIYNKDIRKYTRQAFCFKGGDATIVNTTSRHDTSKFVFTPAKPTSNTK